LNHKNNWTNLWSKGVVTLPSFGSLRNELTPRKLEKLRVGEDVPQGSASERISLIAFIPNGPQDPVQLLVGQGNLGSFPGPGIFPRLVPDLPNVPANLEHLEQFVAGGDYFLPDIPEALAGEEWG